MFQYSSYVTQMKNTTLNTRTHTPKVSEDAYHFNNVVTDTLCTRWRTFYFLSVNIISFFHFSYKYLIKILYSVRRLLPRTSCVIFSKSLVPTHYFLLFLVHTHPRLSSNFVPFDSTELSGTPLITFVSVPIFI